VPVHDVGYRRWEGRLERRVLRWWPIVRRSVPQLLRSRVLIVLLVLCLLFTMVAQVLTIVQLMAGATLMSTWFVKGYMDWMMLFDVTLLVFAGARQIADDMRANAFQIYGARPITWVDYYKAKLCTVAALLCLTTLVPGVAFYAFGVGSQAVLPPLAHILRCLGAIAAYALLITIVLSTAILALSALGKNVWFAGVAFLCLYLFPFLLAEELAEAFASPVPYYFSLHHLLAHAGWECFSAWSRQTDLSWLELPAPALRDLARGNLVSLLGRQEAEPVIGHLYDLARIEAIADPALLKAVVTDRVEALEVVPAELAGMRLGVSLAVLGAVVAASASVTLARLRKAVLER
jgi:hypothetical protein